MAKSSAKASSSSSTPKAAKPKVKSAKVPAKTLELYDALIAAVPTVERKGDANPYTAHKGHMFSMITKEGELALRIAPNEMDDFLSTYKTKYQEAYGVVRKDYAIVPQALFANTKELTPYFVRSYEYIDSLKPKATTKAKK